MKACSITGCPRPACKRTLCATHYQRWYRHGDPMMKLPPGQGFRVLEPARQAQIRYAAGVKGAAAQDRNRELSGWWLRWLLQAVRRETAPW